MLRRPPKEKTEGTISVISELDLSTLFLLQEEDEKEEEEEE
jgi:hypothetical protein